MDNNVTYNLVQTRGFFGERIFTTRFHNVRSIPQLSNSLMQIFDIIDPHLKNLRFQVSSRVVGGDYYLTDAGSRLWRKRDNLFRLLTVD